MVRLDYLHTDNGALFHLTDGVNSNYADLFKVATFKSLLVTLWHTGLLSIFCGYAGLLLEVNLQD